MENNPTQWSPDTKDYDYFIKSPSVYPQLTEDFYNPQFRGFGALGSEHDAYDNMLRDARAREIRAGVIIPTKDSAGKLGFAKDPSTTREKAAAGFERVMESSSAIGWGERNPMSAIEQYRQLTTGNVKDFASASEVESFSLQGFQDYWTSFMDMMPFTSKGSAEASDLMDKFFKTAEADYTPEKKLTALKKLTDENPAIQDFAEAYGVDLTAVALNSKSSMALPFVVENALQDALIQQRYQTYENAELGGFTRLRWNLAEMVQDPSFLRDITITTAATAGLATVEVAAARAGMAGFSAGTKVSQAAAKLLKATGPMVGMVEGPAFLALRAALPRLGTVGARALAIGAEGFTVGSITAAKMQEYDYDRRDLMYNDLDGKPFSPNVAEIAMGGLYGGGLSILAMGGLRTLLGAPGDIASAMQVKRFGGNFSDMTRAYGREWSNSLDTWASTADGLTVWGNELSQGRGIYFGDWLDRVIKRSGIDDRNFTNVFAGKSRVWGRVDPIMAARLNMDMDTVGKIIDEFEAVTGVAGEAAMRGAAGGEVAGVFRVLTDAETLRKSNLNADEVVNILKELKGKLRDLPEVPTPAGALLGKPKDLSYKGTAKAALRSVNLLTLDKALNRRGSNILEARDALLEARRNTVGIDPAKLDIDALNDDDYRALTAGVHFVLGNKIEGQLAATAKFSLDYDPRVFGGPELTEAEVGDIKTSLADKLSDKDEFILTDGNAAVKVNKKTGEVTPLKRELVGDPTGKVEIVVEGRGKLMDLAGDDVVSLEKIAADLNEIKTKVEELFKQKTKEELKETAKKNGAEPEEAEKLLLDLSKGLEPDPKNLKKVFGLSTQHASAAYLLFRAMGYNPEDAVLKLSRGRETRVNRKGNKVIDPYIGETENARIFWNDVGGAANAMIRAVSSRSDLGTAIHEMGHFASLMAFGRGTYDPENLRRMGISEELERKFLDWAGVKTVDKDGNKLTGEQITEQLTSVNVQEKLANAWNVYMRNILTNKSYKGKTEVHRLLNKIGDYVANIGEALKSSQTAEAALAGDVIGKAAEEVFDVLLARSNANIDDLFTFANRRLFAGLSPELRKQVGIEILGEARYNTWLAKGEKDAAKARKNLEVKAAAAAIPTLSHTEMHGVLKGTLGRSATSVKVKKLAEKLAGETPKLADESDADYLARMKDKLQEQVDSINDYIELTATFNTSAFEKGGIAGLAESTVAATAWKTLPRVVAEEDPYVAGRLRAIGSKLLEQYVNDADMDNVLYLRRKVTWDVDDKGEITLRHGVMPVTREQAKAELQRRAELKKPRAEGIEKVKKTTAKKKRIPAAVAKTIETLVAEGKTEEAKAVLAAVPEASRRVKKLVEDKKAETPKEKKAKAKEVAEADKAIAAVEKEVAEVVATVDTVAAEAAAAGDRAVATEVATAVKELAEERDAELVKLAPETSSEVVLTDSSGVVLEAPTATEAIAAVAADAARTVEAASVERITAIAAVDSIEAVARVAPSEPATVRNVINVERPRVTAENTVARLEASAEAVLAAAPPAKAAAATQLLDTVDLTATQQLDTVGKKLSEILEDASEEDVLALIKARLATGSTIIGQLQTAMKTLGMDSATLKNLFDITEDDIQLYIDTRSRLAKMEQVHENKPEVIQALDKLRNSPSQEVVDELLATLQQYRIALSPEAKTRLQGYARVAEAEGSIGLFVDYKQSLDFLVARQKEYDTIMAKSADARTPTEKAVITEYEKNKARVDLGPLHKVSDLQAAEEKVHYRTRQREDREAQLLASNGESEIKDTAARELANTLATPLGMTSDEVKNILLDITTEFTVKERGSLVADAALILASDSKITPEMLNKQTDAYIRAEAKKLRDMIAATGGKARPSDAVLRNHMRRMNNMPSIAPEKVEELVGIFNKQLTASRKTNTNFRKIAEHPTILQYGYYAGGDVMSLLSSVDLLLKNKEKMALLAADDVRLLREKRAEKMVLADRAKSDKKRERLLAEVDEIEKDIVAMSTPEKYTSLVTAALEKGTELPSGMKKAIAARARTLMKTTGRDTAGTTKVTEGMEFATDSGAEARQISRDAKIMANEQAELQSDATVFNFVLDDLRNPTGLMLSDQKPEIRAITADVMEAMRGVVDSEIGIKKPTGELLTAVNLMLANADKPTLTAEKLKTAQKRIDKVMEDILSLPNFETAFLYRLVESRLGTLRSGGKSKAAWRARVTTMLEGKVAVDALKQTEGVKEVPSKPGKTPVKIATDDNKTVVSVDKSFAQTADTFRSIYEAHKVYEETGEVAAGATDLSVVYNAIDSAVAKDVFVGKIKNAYELAKRLSETVQNPEYAGLLKDMLALQAEQLKSISVFMSIRRESVSGGAYHGDLKALTLDFIPGRGNGQLVEEVLVHELIHAATSNYLQTKLDSLGIDHYLEGQKYIDEMRRAVELLREQSSLEDEGEASKLLVIAELIEQYVDWASRVSETEGLSFDRFVMGTLPEDGLKLKTEFAYSARNLDEFMAVPLTNPSVREAFKGFGLAALDDVPLELGSKALRAIAATRQVALNTDDAKTLADIQFANTLIGIIASAASEESMPSLFKFTDIPAASLDDDMFFRYDPGSRTVYPAQAVRRPTTRSFAQGILGPDIETKARADYKAAMGRLLDYSQKRMEWELRSRIETEGMAGKDVAADEARLQDLITSADERQRALKAMGLHEEVEPRDLQALTDIISGNGVLQTSNVPEAMKMIKIRPASPAAKAERPANYRDMNNEQRAQFLLDTVLPRIQEVIGRRDETAGIFSVFSDSTVGRAAFNRLIGGAVEYANVADSHSLYLQFLAKFFDPMMDLRNTELDGTYKMPSVDRLNAEVSSILVTSGLASVQEKIHARVGSQADMDEINDLAWKHLASKETLPETAKNRDLILETIDAVNKVNKQAHDVLAKYGNLRVDADPAGYGTVRKAGYLAHQDRKGFVNALYKFMYRRALEDHDNGRISAIAAEALGWLNMRRNDATEDIVSVSIPADSPLMKLFKDLEPDKDLDWSVARKVLEDAVTKLSKEEQATLRGSLGSTKDYKESYIKLHPYRDDTYSVIRQGAEIAANRYMGIGQVGDAKTIKPRGEAKGGGYKYAEERIMTHQELASDPELSKYFDKNVMELSSALLRNQVLEAMSTKMMTEFFGSETRVSVLDLIEMLRQAGEEEGGTTTMSMKEKLAVDRGYERVKTVWEDFIGKLPSGKDSVDPWYLDFLKASRAAVLTVGGVRAATSSVPELNRAIVASDHHRGMLSQIVGNLLRAVKYGLPYSGAKQRNRLYQAATAYQWLRNMSTDVILARSEMMPDNPFHNLSFGGRRGFLSGFMNAWTGIKNANSVETSNFRKMLNYLGLPASVLGKPLAWINMVTTAIHIENAQRNLSENVGAFRRMAEAVKTVNPSNLQEFERLAAQCGLGGKEALDLQTAGILRPEVIDVMEAMAKDSSTRTDGLMDIRKMYEWGLNQKVFTPEQVSEAINAMQTYVGMTIRHTNAEPTLLDKRVAQSAFAEASVVFMQFLLSHSIQEVGRRRRYSTVNYSRHLVGLILMEAAVGATHKHVWGSDRDRKRGTTEDVIRTATNLPLLGSYQYLGALLRQSAFSLYNNMSDENTFQEKFHVPGLMDSPASNTPRRMMNGTAWGMGILKDLMEVSQ